MTGPRASIIISTYNRPAVLKHAIASVLASDTDDFEIIVAGDGCTDDTEAVVAAFGDPRIVFFNLPANSGGQAAPSNAALARARGRYILFLNHDDLFFPDHISRAIAFLEQSGADLAWSPAFRLGVSDCVEGPPEPGAENVKLDGVTPDGTYDAGVFIVASSWVLRRETAAAIGPWRAETSTRLSPSQEWLYRAHKHGLKLALHPHVSVLCIYGGERQASYLRRESPEHERASDWLASEEARQRLLLCAALHQAALVEKANDITRLQSLSPGARRLTRILTRLGVNPVLAARWAGGEAKGQWIADIRRHTVALFPLAQDETAEAAGPQHARFIGSGWHHAEPDGRWTSRPRAELLFAAPEPGKAWRLDLWGHPLRSGDVVRFNVNDRPAAPEIGDDGATRLTLGKADAFVVSIGIDRPTSPKALDGSADSRILGYRLLRFRLSAAP